MKTIDATTLRTMLSDKDDVLVINVLPPEAFANQHIPDSHNIPVGADDFVEQVERLAGDKSRTIVVYCADAECNASPTAAIKLDKAGFKSVFDFEGGMKAWNEHGFVVAQTTA